MSCGTQRARSSSTTLAKTRNRGRFCAVPAAGRTGEEKRRERRRRFYSLNIIIIAVFLSFNEGGEMGAVISAVPSPRDCSARFGPMRAYIGIRRDTFSPDFVGISAKIIKAGVAVPRPGYDMTDRKNFKDVVRGASAVQSIM